MSWSLWFPSSFFWFSKELTLKKQKKAQICFLFPVSTRPKFIIIVFFPKLCDILQGNTKIFHKKWQQLKMSNQGYLLKAKTLSHLTRMTFWTGKFIITIVYCTLCISLLVKSVLMLVKLLVKATKLGRMVSV